MPALGLVLPCDLPVSGLCLCTGSRGWRIPQLQLLEGSANAASPSLPLPAPVTPFSKRPSQEPSTSTRLLQGPVTEPRHCQPGPAPTAAGMLLQSLLRGLGLSGAVLLPKHIMVPLSLCSPAQIVSSGTQGTTPAIPSLDSSQTPTLQTTAPETRQHLIKRENKFS